MLRAKETIEITNKEEAEALIKEISNGEHKPNLKISFKNKQNQVKEGLGILYGPVGNLQAEELANSVEKILEDKSCPRGLELDFNDYSGINVFFHPIFIDIKKKVEAYSIEPAVKKIAQILEKGAYPDGFSIQVGLNDTWTKECSRLIIDAISKGKCTKRIAIQMGDVVPELAALLKSGKCPEGMELDIMSSLGQEQIQEITSALQHINCPKNLSLKLLAMQSPFAHFLKSAFLSGHCKPGLSIQLYNEPNDAAIIAEAYKIGKVPAGLHFDFVNSDDKNATLLLNALKIAKTHGVLPAGLRITFSPPPRSFADNVSKAIKEEIEEVLATAQSPKETPLTAEQTPPPLSFKR